MHYAKLKLHFRQVPSILFIFLFEWQVLHFVCAAGFIHSLLFDREIIDPFTSMSCTKNEIKRVKATKRQKRRANEMNAEKIK